MELFYRLDKKYYIFLALLFGLVLRLFHLNYEGLWNDELFTAATSNPKNSIADIVRMVKFDIHPPLHNILSYIWSILFSYNDTSMRVFNVLLGLWGMLSVYHLGKLLFNKKVALYALAFATLNYFLIRYSQEVRAYSLLFLLSNYSFYYFIKLMRGELSLRSGLAYALITTGLLYTHYYGMFVVAGQFAASFVVANWSAIKKYKWKYILTFASPVLLFLFWIPALKVHLARNTKAWRDSPDIEMILTYPQQFFNDYILAFIASALIVLTGIYLLFRKFSKIKKLEKLMGGKKKALAVLCIWIAVYFLIPVVKSSISTSMMSARYFIVAVAPIILILAFYLGRIEAKKIRFGMLVGIMGYSLLLLFLNESPYYTQTTTYREIAQAAKAIDNDAPIWNVANDAHNFNYYAGQNHFTNARGHLVVVERVLKKSGHDQYFVFLDLYGTPKKYRDSIPVIAGFEEVYSEVFATRNNIKRTKLIQYRKINDSL